MFAANAFIFLGEAILGSELSIVMTFFFWLTKMQLFDFPYACVKIVCGLCYENVQFRQKMRSYDRIVSQLLLLFLRSNLA